MSTNCSDVPCFDLNSTLQIMKYWGNMNTDRTFDYIKESFLKCVLNLPFKESILCTDI